MLLCMQRGHPIRVIRSPALHGVLRRACGAASIAMLVAIDAGCVPPRSFKQVRRPREGTVMNHRVSIVYSQQYQISFGGLERLHPFDINKYSRIYLQLVTDGLLRPEDVFVPGPATRDELLRAHSAGYLDSLQRPDLVAQYLEFGPAALAPAGLLDAAVLAPFRQATGGTILAARLALRHGIAVNLGGGYHHAEPNRGGGFCIYADMPIAIRTLQAEGRIRRALVVDLDAHQGNGTAECTRDDDSVFTFDMHEGDIYPIPKSQNDLDVPLPAGTDDETYLRTLADRLPSVFERARADIVFYQSGVDGLAEDPLTNLALSPDGIAKRDQLVFGETTKRGVPIVMVLGGGYSQAAWRVQYRTIRWVIETYGLSGHTRRAIPRRPTIDEKLYTK